MTDKTDYIELLLDWAARKKEEEKVGEPSTSRMAENHGKITQTKR